MRIGKPGKGGGGRKGVKKVLLIDSRFQGRITDEDTEGTEGTQRQGEAGGRDREKERKR